MEKCRYGRRLKEDKVGRDGGEGNDLKITIESIEGDYECAEEWKKSGSG